MNAIELKIGAKKIAKKAREFESCLSRSGNYKFYIGLEIDKLNENLIVIKLDYIYIYLFINIKILIYNKCKV
jgi:hypothetical protein